MLRKPIIGIAGGIGSGKTFVARLFGELGCLVIEADALVREAYLDPAIRRTLREWWNDAIFLADGSVDRAAIARKVFDDPEQRQRLERLLHPWVGARREAMQRDADVKTPAFIWDTPLLFETGLNEACDAVVFVEVPDSERLRRVVAQRGWNAEELRRREILQMPLDKKRRLSHYVVNNTAETADMSAAQPGGTRSQVREIFFRIVAGLPDRPIRA